MTKVRLAFSALLLFVAVFGAVAFWTPVSATLCTSPEWTGCILHCEDACPSNCVVTTTSCYGTDPENGDLSCGCDITCQSGSMSQDGYYYGPGPHHMNIVIDQGNW